MHFAPVIRGFLVRFSLLQEPLPEKQPGPERDMHLSFSEAKLEQAIIELLQEQGYPHLIGDDVPRSSLDQVIIEDDLRHYLAARYQADGITEAEIQRLIKQLTTLPASDLYESNKTFCAWLKAMR